MSLGTLAQASIAAQSWLAMHRRPLVGAAIALLTGFGVAAFAVAPLAPDAAALPQRVITEVVQAEPVPPQLEALASLGLDLVRSDSTRAGDTADSLFKRLGVADSYAAAFLRSDAVARRLLDGRAGYETAKYVKQEAFGTWIPFFRDPEFIVQELVFLRRRR